MIFYQLKISRIKLNLYIIIITSIHIRCQSNHNSSNSFFILFHFTFCNGFFYEFVLNCKKRVLNIDK